MKRNISINLELSSKKRVDNRSLIMIRLSENRKHIRFSTGIADYKENFKKYNLNNRNTTETSKLYNTNNVSINWYLSNTKLKINHYLNLNPLLLLSEIKNLLVGELVGRKVIPDINSILNMAYKKNDEVTYTSCNFLITYLNKFFKGIDFRYEHLNDENIEKFRLFMIENRIHKKFVSGSISILNRMKFNIKIL